MSGYPPLWAAAQNLAETSSWGADLADIVSSGSWCTTEKFWGTFPHILIKAGTCYMFSVMQAAMCPPDGSGEDAGHQSARAVSRGAVRGGESQRAEAGEKEAKAKKSTQKQVWLWRIWTGGRRQRKTHGWGNCTLIMKESLCFRIILLSSYITAWFFSKILLMCFRVHLSLLRAAVRPVAATMKKRKRPAVKRQLTAVGAPPVISQTTTNQVKTAHNMKTNIIALVIA